VCERKPSLPQREIERRALVRPAPVRLLDRECRGERPERPLPGQLALRPGRLLAVVGLGTPGYVLALPLLVAAVKPDERRHTGQPACHRPLEPLELVEIDLERQLRDPCVQPAADVTHHSTLQKRRAPASGALLTGPATPRYFFPCPFPPLLLGSFVFGGALFLGPLDFPLAGAPFLPLRPLPWALPLLPFALVWV